MPEPPDRGPAAYLAEFIGTFTLVFFITMAVSLYVTPPVNGQQPFIDMFVFGDTSALDDVCAALS